MTTAHVKDGDLLHVYIDGKTCRFVGRAKEVRNGMFIIGDLESTYLILYLRDVEKAYHHFDYTELILK